MADVLKATHLLFSDDFTSYTSDADVTAVYGDDYDDLATDWGSNYGPDGQPGIKDQVVGAARDSGSIIKGGLNPNGREFRFKGRWDFAETNHITNVHFVIYPEYESEEIFLDRHWQLNHNHNTSTLSLVIATKSPYGNVTSNNFHLTDLTGVAPSDSPITIEVKWRQSVMTEVSAGVFEPSTDGRVELWLDDVRVVEFDGPVWSRDTSFGSNPQWTSSHVDTLGAFTAWEVWDEPTPSTDDGGDQSVPCCNESTGTPSGGDIGTNPDPVGALPPWDATCEGGGQVEGVSDLVDGESWF